MAAVLVHVRSAIVTHEPRKGPADTYVVRISNQSCRLKSSLTNICITNNWVFTIQKETIFRFTAQPYLQLCLAVNHVVCQDEYLTRFYLCDFA